MNKYNRFGVMIDCSRNAVPNVSSVKKMIDCLGKMGYDTLELYTEDTYEVTGEPYFGYLRGRYSGEEIKEIDAYAAAHGIELIPCIQTLAHFTNPVKLPRFAEITDSNDILLVDEEKTYEFLNSVFASLAKNFTSRQVNIGMDEAHSVGLGKYLDKHGYADRFGLLSRHLSRVAEIAAKYGFSAHMWSDMFFRLAAQGEYYGHDVRLPAEITDKLPDNVELAYWDYYHTEKQHFDKMIELHKKFNRDLWFAGGVWTWAGFAPHSRLAKATMRAAMQSVRTNGIKNVLITMWGDNGGECPPFAALQSLYAVRRYADGEFDETVIATEFEKLFGVSYADFDLLELPDTVPDMSDVLAIPTPAKALLYTDPFLGVLDTAIAEHKPIPYAAYAESLEKAKLCAKEYAYLFDVSAKLCRLMDLKAYLGVRTRRAYTAKDKKELARLAEDYKETENRLDVFFEAFGAQWNTVNKPFGFEVHCARIGGVKLRLSYCRGKLEAYIAGKLQRIDELEEIILPLDPKQSDNLLLNDYRRSVSVSEI